MPFGPECRIFEVCNPHQATKVLEANLEISIPRRILADSERPWQPPVATKSVTEVECGHRDNWENRIR